MSVLEKQLKDRSEHKCELCGDDQDLQAYQVPPTSEGNLEDSILACTTCKEQLEDPEKVVPNHWRCLNESMWNEHLPVQVVAWRMLNQLRGEDWPQDLLEMLYLEEDALAWAKATEETEEEEEKIIHKDSNGNSLADGDSVVLIKDLDVKGANFTAKRGAAVRRISLVWDNAEQIEGRADGQQIMILTQYVKKTK